VTLVKEQSAAVSSAFVLEGLVVLERVDWLCAASWLDGMAALSGK